jgi:hypothetical protein
LGPRLILLLEQRTGVLPAVLDHSRLRVRSKIHLPAEATTRGDGDLSGNH